MNPLVVVNLRSYFGSIRPPTRLENWGKGFHSFMLFTPNELYLGQLNGNFDFPVEVQILEILIIFSFYIRFSLGLNF